MPNSKPHYFIPIALGVILLISLLLFWPAQHADAQCGSQASSCKNCHEVQGQKPVNNDGTTWHKSHAFGDFCYICHAGNQQATDKDTSHAGMVPPLQDIKASCQQCHPNDLQERAQVYATALGVEIKTGSTSIATPVLTSGPTSVPIALTAPVTNELIENDPNLVDYVKNYNEIVLGKKPINWGNAILLCLIGLVAVGGGGFVVTREKLVKVSFGDTKKAEGEYPADVIDMLPAITGLKSTSRKSLMKVLDNPKKAEKVLDLMDAVISNEERED